MQSRAQVLLSRACRARTVHALVLTRVLIGALLLSGCVSATSYEQVTSAAEVEREAHRRTKLRLEVLESRVAELEAERAQLSQKLALEEESAASAAMNVETTKKERDLQSDLVNQLKSELERVGGHLKSYAEEKDSLAKQKSDLESELAEAMTEVERLRGSSPAPESEIAREKPPKEELDESPSKGTDSADSGSER